MSSVLRIRRLGPADARALAALAAATFRDTFTGTCTEDDMQQFLAHYYNEDRIRHELQQPDECTFFAERDHIPVGYLRIHTAPPGFPCPPHQKALELNRLYVEKSEQGQGVAQALMDCYLRYARDGGYDLLWLGVWEHNYRAQAFYRKYGFAATGHSHPFPIGHTPQTDLWWMRRL